KLRLSLFVREMTATPPALLQRKRTPLTVLSFATMGALVLGCNQPKREPAADTSSAPEATAKAVDETAAKKMPAATVDSLTLPVMPELPKLESNPQTPEKIELGRRLFFDKRLSVDGSVSCYSCHQDEQGGGGKDPLAVGALNKTLPRHSPVIWNAGHLPSLYWDGRADSLEAQAKGAWGGANMGVGKENLDKKAQEVAALPEYKKDFKQVFPGQPVTGDLVAQALSAFERTLECKSTAYDKYAAGDKAALSVEQKVGLEVFLGKGMCSACHAPPFFSAAYVGKGAFFNVGVGTKDVPEDKVDVGRMKVSEDAKDWAAFKVPSLRNVTQSAPYFHDGSAATLKDAVHFMARGGHDNKNKNPLMSDKQLSEAEMDSIIAFLSALDCEGTIQVAAKE
ncbi:MAG TPA: cytochrome c peroxidase, partial [Polyangiaceae bacterium]|nr:cytochrome c peroxidase [Polyangiaceae bacterium]